MLLNTRHVYPCYRGKYLLCLTVIFFLGLTDAGECATGNLRIDVKKIDGTYVGAGANVNRYSSSWVYLDNRTTDSSGCAFFSGVDEGTYNFEAWYNGEFWGGKSGAVIAGESHALIIQRFMPYACEMKVYSGSTEVTGGSVPLGTVLRFEVKVKNDGAVSYNSRVHLRVDASQTSPYDFDSTTVSQTISSGGTVTFIVNFTNTVAATYYRWVEVETDTNGGTYTKTDSWAWGSVITVYAPPEVSVYGAGGNVMTDGDTTPIPNDGTDFGTITEGGSTASCTFEVRNDGGSVLTLGTVSVPAGFTVTEGLASSLAPGGSDTFTVRLDNTSAGTKTGDISFSNNDNDENPFNFRITGTVNALPPPEISVYGAGGYLINDGDTTPIPNDGTDYGVITEGGSTASGMFEVRNDGGSTLTLGAVSVPTGFTLTEGLSTSLAPGASDTFTVCLDNTSAGTKTGDISFSNNDSNENPFSFRITGKVNALPGTLNVTVKQLGGTNQAGAIVRLYTNGWGYLDQKITVASGIATWTGMPSGVYIAEAYLYNATHNTNEFWGGVTGIEVASGGNANTTIQRHMPYASDMRFFNGSTDVTGGSVPAGTVITIKASIRNPGSSGYNTRSVVWLDRTNTAGNDYTQTGADVLVPAYQTVTQTFNFTVSSTGVYSRTLQVQTDIDGYKPTDAWDWQPVVTAIPVIIPEAFALIYPSNQCVNTGTRPNFLWEPSEGATGYELHIAESGGAEVVCVSISTNSAVLLATAMRAGTRYDWWVVATNSTATRSSLTNTFNTGDKALGCRVIGLEQTPDNKIKLEIAIDASGFTPTTLAVYYQVNPIFDPWLPPMTPGLWQAVVATKVDSPTIGSFYCAELPWLGGSFTMGDRVVFCVGALGSQAFGLPQIIFSGPVGDYKIHQKRTILRNMNTLDNGYIKLNSYKTITSTEQLLTVKDLEVKNYNTCWLRLNATNMNTHMPLRGGAGLNLSAFESSPSLIQMGVNMAIGRPDGPVYVRGSKVDLFNIFALDTLLQHANIMKWGTFRYLGEETLHVYDTIQITAHKGTWGALDADLLALNMVVETILDCTFLPESVAEQAIKDALKKKEVYCSLVYAISKTATYIFVQKPMIQADMASSDPSELARGQAQFMGEFVKEIAKTEFSDGLVALLESGGEVTGEAAKELVKSFIMQVKVGQAAANWCFRMYQQVTGPSESQLFLIALPADQEFDPSQISFPAAKPLVLTAGSHSITNEDCALALKVGDEYRFSIMARNTGTNDTLYNAWMALDIYAPSMDGSSWTSKVENTYTPISDPDTGRQGGIHFVATALNGQTTNIDYAHNAEIGLIDFLNIGPRDQVLFQSESYRFTQTTNTGGVVHEYHPGKYLGRVAMWHNGYPGDLSGVPATTLYDAMALPIYLCGTTHPAAPTGMTTSSGINTIRIGWSPPSSPVNADVIAFAVYRSDSNDTVFSSSNNVIGLVARGQTSVQQWVFDSNVVQGVTYYYGVRSLNALNELSGFSDTVTGLVASSSFIVTPTNLTKIIPATGIYGIGEVTVINAGSTSLDVAALSMPAGLSVVPSTVTLADKCATNIQLYIDASALSSGSNEMNFVLKAVAGEGYSEMAQVGLVVLKQEGAYADIDVSNKLSNIDEMEGSATRGGTFILSNIGSTPMTWSVTGVVDQTGGVASIVPSSGYLDGHSQTVISYSFPVNPSLGIDVFGCRITITGDQSNGAQEFVHYVSVHRRNIGAIQVCIDPELATAAGAQWRIDGGSWLHSGNVVSGLSTGLHTVSFAPAIGYVTPSDIMTVVLAGATNAITATYPVAGSNTLNLATLYYTCDQTNGTTILDRSGANNGLLDDSTYISFVYSDDLGRYCIRKQDSTTSGITPSSSPVTRSTFTVSCWAKPAPENDPASGAFFFIGSSPEKSYRLYTDRVNYQYSDWNTYPQRSGTFTGTGGWHHYAWVNEDLGDGSAHMRMFVDGVKLLDDMLSSSEYTPDVAVSQKFLVQRPHSVFYYQFIGELCNIAVFDGLALTDEQVADACNETDPRTCLQISTTVLPAGMEMTPYNAFLTATNGVSPFSWAVMPGVFAWGANGESEANLPHGLANVSAVAAGISYSLALKTDGTVVAWGVNDYGQTNVPPGLWDVTAISAGWAHNLALRADGTVVGWGNNGDGQTVIPAGLTGVVAVAAGWAYSLALKSDGTVVAWGDGEYGQTDVPLGLTGVVAIAAGWYHSLALKSDGTVVAWGANGGRTDVPPGLADVAAIAAGGYHSLALKSDGTVVAWGDDFFGQTDVPVDLTNVVAIAAGEFHSLALKRDGSVVAWGGAGYGEIDVPPVLRDVVGIAAGWCQSLAFRSQSTQLPAGLFCSTNGIVFGVPIVAGTNVVTFIVQDSAGAITNKPLNIVVAPNPNRRPIIKSNAPSVSACSMDEASIREFHVSAYDPEGMGLTYYWTLDGLPVGDNADSYTYAPAWGTAGLHTLRCYVADDLWTNIVYAQWNVTVFDIPLEILTDTLPEGIGLIPYGACLQVTNGVVPYSWRVMPRLVAWGLNDNGQTDVPPGLDDVVAVTAGYNHSLALKSDGTVVGWGGDLGERYEVGLDHVVAIAAGYDHSLALRSDGTVIAWGGNQNGQTTVPAGLSNVVAIVEGGAHSLALKADGTIVGWGRSSEGQISIPSGLSNVTAIAAGQYHSVALKSDGTVMAWGWSQYGQTTVPVGLSNVVAIAAGQSHSVALKSDGTVVAWGDSLNGQTNIPLGLTNVVAIAAGCIQTLALKADGTILVWGPNWYGEADVPPGLNGVVAIAAGAYHCLAIRSNTTQLPEGLSCSTNGIVSGIPIQAGTSVVTFVVQDNVAASTNKTLQLVVETALATNNVPKWWLASYGSTNFNDDAMRDIDDDGLLTWQEWIAGTDPTNKASVFHLDSSASESGQGFVLRWFSNTNRFYNLSRATNLLGGPAAFIVLPDASNMPATPTVNSYTDVVQGVGPYFYKIEVRE